jgi:hypothetical protein
MTPIPTDEARADQRKAYNLHDLCRMPTHLREAAYDWGGTFPESIALYQVASTDGLTRNPAELRHEIEAITNGQTRKALLAWLGQAEDRT